MQMNLDDGQPQVGHGQDVLHSEGEEAAHAEDSGVGASARSTRSPGRNTQASTACAMK